MTIAAFDLTSTGNRAAELQVTRSPDGSRSSNSSGIASLGTTSPFEVTLVAISSEQNSVSSLSLMNPVRGLNLADSRADDEFAVVEAVKRPVPLPISPVQRTENSTPPNSPTILSLNHARQVYSDSVAQVSDQLATAITSHLGTEPTGGPTTIQIRLDRLELGTVSLHLSITNDVVSIRIVAHDQVVRQIIDSQLDELRQSLSNSGVLCGQCLVACDSSARRFSDPSGPRRSVVAQSATFSTSRWARPNSTAPQATPATGQFNFVA